MPEPARGSRRRFLLAAVVAAVIGALGGVLAHAVTRPEDTAVAFTPPRELAPDFRLRDQDGRYKRLADARGQVLVLTFLYSHCPDLCPAQASKIATAVVSVGKGVQVYGVSVDPEGDTPAAARGFLKRRGLYGGPVSFLVGTRRELAPVWEHYGIVPITATPAEERRALAAYQRLRASEGEHGKEADQPAHVEYEEYKHELDDAPQPPAARDPYPAGDDLRYRGRRRHVSGLDFEHSAYVMLIDKHGRQRVGYSFEQLDPDLLARDMRALLAES